MFASVTANVGWTARARSAKRRTDSTSSNAGSGGRTSASGRPSGGTGNSRSPETRSAARLVASTFRCGQAASSFATVVPAAGRSCSTLSRSSRHDAERRWSIRRWVSASVRGSRKSSALAIAPGIAAGSAIAASGTKTTPSANAIS